MSDHSARGKSGAKKKFQKETYKEKNKSSPTLTPSTSEKSVLFQYKASSKPPESSNTKSLKKDVKHNKVKKAVTVQTPINEADQQSINSHNFSAQKKPFTSVNISKSATSINKNDKQKPPNVSKFVSPQFMSLSMQSNLKSQPASKQTQNTGKFQHGYPHKSFNESCNNNTVCKEVTYNKTPKPPSQNLMHGQAGNNRFFSTQKNFGLAGSQNIRFQGVKQSNLYDRGISAQKNFRSNLTPFQVHERNVHGPKHNSPVGFVHKRQFNTNACTTDPKCSIPSVNKNFTSQIKYKKKKPKFNNTNSCPGKVSKTHFNHQRNKDKKQVYDFKKKVIEQDNNVAPLLSFQSVNTAPVQVLDLMHFSDDEDCSVNSQNSVDNVANLIDFSDCAAALPNQSSDYMANLIDLSDLSVPKQSVSNVTTQIFSSNESETDSDSTDESEESDVTSEFSVDSSILDSESKLNILKSSVTKESFVSVFWDIENCALPSKKSAIDFASYVRDTFYDGRTEVQFTAACDVSNLNTILVRELDEAAITLIHISSVNKNAADKKIQALLQKFQIQYRKSNSAVVLISSDSDFSQVLLDMRYQHHIFINLICNNRTRDSLTTAANKCVFFDDIIKDLPDRNAKNNMQHILSITNLPGMKCKVIKSNLSEKLSGFNCRIKFVNASTAKVIFKDHSVCLKAMTSLKGFYLGGNALDITYQKELIENDVVSKKEKKSNSNLQSLEKNVKNTGVSESVTSNSQVTKESSSSNGASLSIFVSTYLGNTEHWKKVFEDIWKTTEFSINWEGSILDGYFLVSFKSLKKAQKAKKLLQKNQISDSDAPKFLKLIKHGEDLGGLNGNILSSIEESNKKKIDEYIQIVEKKKFKFLRKHESIMNEMNHHGIPEVYKATGVIADKLKEYNEQMETFINFSNITINIIKSLCHSSENLEQNLKELLCDFTRECNCISSALPIYAKKNYILEKIRNNQVIIIRAETGSGKSTQLTQYVWREKNLVGNGKIICTQPRKIAAISLAKYVSSQIGSSLGDIVGYRVGMANKTSLNTRIVYVTDFTMLKIIVNEDLNDVSCIIIDEAHERTIYTDILIGMIKRYLPKYPHLKIVLTSATIDTSVFQDYFSLTDSSVLHISGRTYPIEDVWLDHDVTPNWDYFNKTIDRIFDILTGDPGDVLSFLTTPLECEKAFKSFSDKLIGNIFEKKIKVFCLHGKMNSEEQQKIFEKNPNGTRKVIFATNCAETSITVPGIKYVIDCGLVKESQYDAVRNMNVLSVGFVSKSSAEQRRGRAGRTQMGKCYRLYSKSNYDNMANNTDPEILRINLGQAIMKLLKMGVTDPLKFDFLQSPSREQLILAMDQLFHLKAVDENTFTLTDLGNKMAVLPFEPRLCHLILQGFDNGIGYDALVLAALITMSHSLFFYNFENKDETDRKKRRFCESENDFISYLEVYKEWSDIPKNLKSQWCVINCINARSMRTVHELVNEIILTLQKELCFKVKLKFSSESTYDILQKIIFYSFSQNLAVFSGHPKFGYRCLNFPDRLLIHPSSSVCTFGQQTPQFVVYGSVLKTSEIFMINVCPVSKDIILDAVNLHEMKIDLMSLENLAGIELCISPLGEKVIINNFIGKKGLKRKNLQRKIKEVINSDFVEVDIDIAKGCVKIFCFGSKHEEIKSIVSPIIEEAQQALLNEEKVVSLFEGSPFTTILVAGGLIHDVVLPGEFRDVKVMLKDLVDIESVVEKLSLCGSITEVREWNKYFKVTFQTTAAAKKALNTYCKENTFSLQSIYRCSSYKERDHLYKVLMSFYRRPCIGIAYLSFDQQIPLSSLPSTVIYNDEVVRVSVSKKTGDIRLTDLPLNADRKTLESFVSTLLPSDIKITKCQILRKNPYETNKEEMELIKKNISNLFAEFTSENVEVYLMKPNLKDFVWNATVFIKNSRDGETAVNVLKNQKCVPNFLGGFSLKPELQTYLYCKSEIFSVVRNEIENALQFFKTNQPVGNELNLNAIPKGTDSVEIKIVSNNVSDITDARRFIHDILSGDELFLECSDKEKLFSNLGKELLKKLSADFQDCYILQNNYSKAIFLYGKESSMNIIKMHINEFLTEMENCDYKELSLKTNSGKTVLKELLRKYGYDLQKLKEECNASDIQINKFKQILTVQGNLSSVSKCENFIQDIKKNMDADFSEVNGEICPVCSDEVSNDKHRLEYCGHAYCTECLLHLFQSSENIPLSCEMCQDPIVLADIFWCINGRSPLKKVIFEKFLHYFVASRNDISFCPSPDCTMIFRVTKEEMNIFKCPICGNSICTRCEALYHYGMTCSLYKCLESDSDYSLKVWMEEDPSNHKQCPSCSSPIEKNGGCNHMTCWKCKSHMCWLCLKVFPTAEEVYGHQDKCPSRRLVETSLLFY